MNENLIDFQILGDERGSLISLEGTKNVPFDIKRVYYIFGTKMGVRRGFHAHKNLQQILIAVNGSCKVHLNDGSQTREVILSKPNKGLQINGLVWREMYDFTDDCVLLVLANNYYDEDDYIRDYEKFVEAVK
ncbi:FdtA/QdtA family cupin domain-containing protein [Neobacillus drentensis]|uniref:sugar 3,4-ketoisomerase n=1 Tax=Neobacillus drentensis TaxID=220684 RepID=UPI002FFD8125